MPHATDSLDAQGIEDDLLIRQALDLGNPLGIPLEIGPGEKADNAVDYADLADDDLADEEDYSIAVFTGAPEHDVPRRELEELLHESEELRADENGSHKDDMDELFGEIPQSPSGKPPAAANPESGCSPEAHLDASEDQYQAWDAHNSDQQHLALQNVSRRAKTESSQLPILQALNAQKVSKEEQMQRYLISLSAQGAAAIDSRPEPGSDDVHVQDLVSLWPRFEQDSIPRFMDLLPHKKAHYIGKKPLKQPKPVHPTKLNLDLALDQEKQFRLSSGPNRRGNQDDEGHTIVRILPIKYSDEESTENISLLSDCENEIIGGATWQDMQIICEDWDDHSFNDSTAGGSNTSCNDTYRDMDSDRVLRHGSDQQWYMPPAKVGCPNPRSPSLLSMRRDAEWSLTTESFFTLVNYHFHLCKTLNT